MILEITLSYVGRIRNKRVLGDLVHVWVLCEIMILEITPDSSAKKRPQTLILEMTPVFSVNWPQTYRMLEEFGSKVCEVIWFILGSSVKLNYDFGNDLRLIKCWKNPDQKCLRWRLPEGHPLLPTHSQCLFTTRTALEIYRILCFFLRQKSKVKSVEETMQCLFTTRTCLENLQDFVFFFASKVDSQNCWRDNAVPLHHGLPSKFTGFCVFFCIKSWEENSLYI